MVIPVLKGWVIDLCLIKFEVVTMKVLTIIGSFVAETGPKRTEIHQYNIYWKYHVCFVMTCNHQYNYEWTSEWIIALDEYKYMFEVCIRLFLV